MHAYSVYGLSLLSEFPIPEMLALAPASLPSGAEPVTDVTVSIGEVPKDWFPTPQAANTEPMAGGTQTSNAGGAPGTSSVGARSADELAPAVGHSSASIDLAEEGESWAERRADGSETLCVFDGVGRYVIARGRSILVEADPAADFDVVRHLLLGPVLAQLLWQRDIFTLHASVLGFGSAGRHTYAAFVGVSGEGKSTTAAALEAAGHALVCDDVAALVDDVPGEGKPGLRVLPAFPRIRLYEDSVRSVGDDPARHPLVHSLIDKRSKAVEGFQAESVPLHRLYVLATGDDFAIEPLAPREAVMEILRHTYYAHQYAPLYGFKRHLQQAARVAERVAAFRLTRPKDLARLPELVGLLEAHAAR